MKARTKAKRLAVKRQRAMEAAGLPELAPIKRRGGQPREGGRFVKVNEDPREAALNVRCKRFGVPQDRQGRAIVSGQHMCCDLGFVIESRCGNADVARLWDVFHRWTRAEVVYRVRYLGQGDAPASAALMMVHDRVETDPSATVDARAPDERDRDAVNGWMRWQGFLGHLSADQRAILHHARRDDGPALWGRDGVTEVGLFTLSALRDLADVSERGASR